VLCYFAECHDYLNVMLSVVMLNVLILKVVAPLKELFKSDGLVKIGCGFRLKMMKPSNYKHHSMFQNKLTKVFIGKV
jgi:hypothetical protein